MNERCYFFKRAFPIPNSTRLEIAWCTSPKGKGTDQQCGGYENFCTNKQFLPDNASLDLIGTMLTESRRTDILHNNSLKVKNVHRVKGK